MTTFPRIARFRTAAALRDHLRGLGAPIPLDDAPLTAAAGSPLAAPIAIKGAPTLPTSWSGVRQ